jgi:hypothetical protein
MPWRGILQAIPEERRKGQFQKGGRIEEYFHGIEAEFGIREKDYWRPGSKRGFYFKKNNIENPKINLDKIVFLC